MLASRPIPRAPLLIVLLAASVAAAGFALAIPPTPGGGTYEGPGTIVTSFRIAGQQITTVDNGAVLCRDGNGDGTPDAGKGGVCIPFADLQGSAVYVEDSLAGTNVAFQVCIDNNGDGICGLADVTSAAGPCNDQIVFSHDSAGGWFSNPLKIPGFGFLPGCDVGQFPGLVVILCAGVHDNETATNLHFHNAENGVVSTVSGGGPSGDYCNAPTATKAYRLLPSGL